MKKETICIGSFSSYDEARWYCETHSINPDYSIIRHDDFHEVRYAVVVSSYNSKRLETSLERKSRERRENR